MTELNIFLVFTILIALVVLLLVLFIFWLFQFSYSFDKNKIGYLPTNSKKVLNTLLEVFERFEIKEADYDFVELGCGLANVAGWVYSNHTFKKVIGVEMDFMTVFMARMLAKLKKQKLQLIRKNVFDFDIQDKSVIYCYLGHTILNNLYKQKN